MNIRTLAWLALPALLLLAPIAAGQQTPAKPAAPAAAAPVKKERPAIYDEKADAKAEIAAALARAKKENRRVLIQWGANWCGWCHLLHSTFKSDQSIKKELLYEYDLVLVDIGRFDKNMDLAGEYKADIKSGVPYLTVLDADGKPIANQETGSLELPAKEGSKEYSGHDPAKVLAFLKQHESTPLKADDVLASGLARAREQGKCVFLHFGAPWCVWCHRLEDWMARPEIAATLAKDFIDIKIDTDRMTGGQALYAKQSGNDKGGIPWFAFLSAEGKVLATSDAPGKGNVGFPAADHEIAHFQSMLKAARRHMTESEAAALIDSLQAAAAKSK